MPVSTPLTADEAYSILHSMNAAANVADLVAKSPYSNIGDYVYGVFTYYEKDVRNLAIRFMDMKPRLDSADGLKFAHYNVNNEAFSDIHFWFWA